MLQQNSTCLQLATHSHFFLSTRNRLLLLDIHTLTPHAAPRPSPSLPRPAHDRQLRAAPSALTGGTLAGDAALLPHTTNVRVTCLYRPLVGDVCPRPLSRAAPATCVSPKNHTGLHAGAPPALPCPARPTSRNGFTGVRATRGIPTPSGWDDRSTYQGPPGVYCPSHPVRPRAGPTGPPSTVEGRGRPAFGEPVRIKPHQKTKHQPDNNNKA